MTAAVVVVGASPVALERMQAVLAVPTAVKILDRRELKIRSHAAGALRSVLPWQPSGRGTRRERSKCPTLQGHSRAIDDAPIK